MGKLYDYVYYLSETLGNRLSTSLNEKRAADWIFKTLQSFNLSPVMERFRTPSSAYSFFQFIFLCSFLISLFYLQFHYILKIFFLIIELFLIYIFYREFNFNHTFLYDLLKRKDSQNVFASVTPIKEKKKHIYISAHVDSATAGVLFNESIVKFLNIQMKIVFYSLVLVFVNSLLYLFFSTYFFVMVFIGLSGFYFISFFIAFHTEYLAQPASGANDNASSVGVTLGLMEYFSKNRPDHTEITGLFTGSEENGCIGIYEFLNKHKVTIDPDAIFLVLDCTGIGDPVYLRSEGMLKKYYADPKLLVLAEQVSRDVQYSADMVDLPVGYTEYNVINNFKYRGMAIGAVPKEKEAVPNWHQTRDNIVYIHKETLENVSDFVKKIIKKIDEVPKEV
ncbi:MAG: M28 family peptidase [Spirochaetes bacterium]|nr:M28 family peptidase [Spirochaetota bacterium]